MTQQDNDVFLSRGNPPSAQRDTIGCLKLYRLERDAGIGRRIFEPHIRSTCASPADKPRHPERSDTQQDYRDHHQISDASSSEDLLAFTLPEKSQAAT